MNRAIAASMICVLVLWIGTASAEVPAAFSYQGYLTDSVGNPVSGEWTITFSFYPSAIGGEPFFEETVDVTTELGLFTALLGVDPGNTILPELFAAGQAHLELAIETEIGPVLLEPRQQVVSNPYAMYSLAAEQCEEASNAISLAGVSADTYVTLEQIPQLCVAPDQLEGLILALGFVPGPHYGDADVAAWLVEAGYVPGGGYGDEQVAAYLLANGYEPGPHFSGLYTDLDGAPNLSDFLTKDNALSFLATSGAVLMSDGSVALEGPLEFAGLEALNMAVHGADTEPEDATAGQLWWDTQALLLKVYTGFQWAPIGLASAGDLACQECVDADDVAFHFAAADQKGGAALNLSCVNCVAAGEVSFAWAKGVLPGGDAEHALTAGVADDLNCAGCVSAAELDPAAMAAKFMAYDDSKTDLGVGNVQAAVEKMADALGSGPADFQEGNGTVLPFAHHWGLPAYGSASAYVHLMNPTIPKVMSYVYAEESSSFSTSNNLVVAYDFSPNQYTRITNANAGEGAMQVDNPSIFTEGAHVLVHQTVGESGNGAGAGHWELTQVIGVEGNTILLAKPLAHSYVACGPTCGEAQAVIAASYNQLEVVNGGQIRPGAPLGDWSHQRGGILYIRARKIVVKSGGKIIADNYGFRHGTGNYWSWESSRGCSECNAHYNSTSNKGTSSNCSAGGGGQVQCCDEGRGGGGGGGHKSNGTNGTGSQPGQGGKAVGDADLSTLHFGGGGGGGRCASGGKSGGIIVLGAETIIVESGGRISANGGEGSSNGSWYCTGGGGGAGGTVALYASNIVNDGTVEVAGGAGGTGPKGNGGQGSEGWLVEEEPVPGVVNESFAKGVEIYVDGENVTGQLGDPNGKGFPAWDDVNKKWGASGLKSWSTGALDLSAVAAWTLGEHRIELKETGGSGGDLKMYMYVIYPFSKSTAPINDTCDQPVMLDLTGPQVLSGTTEDVMGKIKATNANLAAFCGGSGGPDVVYGFTLQDWRQLTIDVTSAFTPRTYIKKADCETGEVVGCGENSWVSSVFEPGTYYLFVDADGNLQKGNFALSVTPAPPGPPANDTCAAPQALVFENGTAQAAGMTLFSSDSASAVCGGAGAPENIYQITVPGGTTNLNVAVDADFDPVIYVTKDDCGAAPIACVPDTSYTAGWPTPGIYYIFVDGKTADDMGLYTLTVTAN
jgi:hypothetical protein